jgi:Raf kinase inhibitor-like YbhB/YbcL family protein
MKKIGLIAYLFTGTLSLIADGFTLSSSDISGQLSKSQEFSGFGCSGKNMSPALEWKDPPKGTKSFALTLYDPDAPTGSGWWHWLVFNIPKSVTHLAENASAQQTLPKGAVESVNDYGQTQFGGACPPPGDKAHRYVLTVYALDVEKLELDAKARPALVGYMLNAHAMPKARQSGTMADNKHFNGKQESAECNHESA